jgi:hypothetical protein
VADWLDPRGAACALRDAVVSVVAGFDDWGYCTASAVMSSNDSMVHSSGVRVAREVYSPLAKDWIARSEAKY